MKILHFSIISLGSILLSALFGNGAYAQCIPDTDWPEKPCLDTPPYSDSEIKKLWEPYYTMKGKDWMEMKKAEMDTAIKDGALKQWTEYGGSSNNFANYNVWFYYHLYGQAPDLAPYYSGNIAKDDFKPVVSYYYVSLGAIILIGIVASSVGVAGFFVARNLSKNRIKK